MPQTPNHGYNVPNKGDANWHQPLNDNFERYDTDIEIRDADGNKGNYTPKQGAKFLATDTGVVYVGDGQDWLTELALARFADDGSVTLGDSSNSAANGGSVGGGENNAANGAFATVPGGRQNSAGPRAAVGGGTGNEATGSNATVGGGEDNAAGGEWGTVGGGTLNEANSRRATVAGGAGNVAGEDATVGGGSGNDATGIGATVSGGSSNEASGDHATVGGCEGNVASGQHATVAGGRGSRTTAPNAFAAGTNASADHEGAFVYSDTSSGGLSSLNPNEFAVSAAGGVFFFSNASATTGVELTSGSGSWSSASSRALKSNVDPVDPVDVLDRVADLEISTWNYDAEGEDVRHMGPMAEDFAAAFGLGSDDGKISNVDADGVAFAAIQGLAEELDERDAQIEEQQSTIDDQRERIDELAAENAALGERVDAIAEQIDRLAPDAAGPPTADD